MRTLNKIFKLDKEKFKIPRCVQDIIPIKAIWEDGIFQVSKNKFSKLPPLTVNSKIVAKINDNIFKDNPDCNILSKVELIKFITLIAPFTKALPLKSISSLID